MIVNTIISSVKKYFTTLSVASQYGYTKVALIEADNSKRPTGSMVEIDATSTLNLTISKQLIQHSAESKKVYMDGAKQNPNRISIRGHIDATSIPELERMAKDDVWMFISHTKDMGGVQYSAGGGNPLTISNIGNTVNDPIGSAKNLLGFGNETEEVGLYADCKLYTISSLGVNDTGFMNTVDISIDLVEVVLFEFDVRYKFGSNTDTKKVQNSGKSVYQTPVAGFDTYVPPGGGK